MAIEYDIRGVDLIDRRTFKSPTGDDLDEYKDFADEFDQEEPVDAIPVAFIRETLADIDRMLPGVPTNCATALSWLIHRWRRAREDYFQERGRPAIEEETSPNAATT